MSLRTIDDDVAIEIYLERFAEARKIADMLKTIKPLQIGDIVTIKFASSELRNRLFGALDKEDFPFCNMVMRILTEELPHTSTSLYLDNRSKQFVGFKMQKIAN